MNWISMQSDCIFNNSYAITYKIIIITIIILNFIWYALIMNRLKLYSGRIKCIWRTKSQFKQNPKFFKEFFFQPFYFQPPAGMCWKTTAQENLFNAIESMLRIIPKGMKNVTNIRVQVNGMKHIDIIGNTRREWTRINYLTYQLRISCITFRRYLDFQRDFNGTRVISM